MSRAINVDETNVTMKARTAWSMLIVIILFVVSLTAYAANLSTKVDLTKHNVSHGAHKSLQDTVAKNTLGIAGIRKAQFEQRAEDLAYRVIDALPPETPRGTVQHKFESVKARAMSNLDKGKDIREGMSLSDF